MKNQFHLKAFFSLVPTTFQMAVLLGALYFMGPSDLHALACLTNTPTVTPTATVTKTSSPTGTLSPSPTPMNTLTPTITVTFTSTPTGLGQINVSSIGVMNPLSQPAGVPVTMSFTLTNNQWMPFNVNSIQFQASGTGNDATGISSVSLYLGTGQPYMTSYGLITIVNPGFQLLGTATYPSDDGAITFSGSPLLTVINNDSQTLYLVYNFSSSAPLGTYQATIPTLGVQGNVSCVVSTALTDVNLPQSSQSITIANFAFSPTGTFSVTPTSTGNGPCYPIIKTNACDVIATLTASVPTLTPVVTFVTMTNTPTALPSNTPTKTPTISFTSTNTLNPTNTPTGSATPTPTNTTTFTPTTTNTNTPTITYTPANTGTPTPTPTGTWFTSTPTMTWTSTKTPTITLTPTNTFTPINTPTGSATPTTTNTTTITWTPTNTNTINPTVTPTNCGPGTTLILNLSGAGGIIWPRSELAVGVINNILYAVGGYNGTTVSNELEGGGGTLASMPTARAELAVGVVNGILYAVGGNNGSTVLNTVEAYNPSTNTWTTGLAPMPTARQGLGIGVINGILYAVGGVDAGGNALNTVEAYNPSTNTWTTGLPPMLTARSGLGVAVANGILYAVGGTSTTGTSLTTMEAYDPSTNSWSSKASTLTGLSGVTAVVMNQTLYAMGNYGNIEAYDIPTDTWSLGPNMLPPPGRANFAAGVINGVLYGVGGFNPINGYLKSGIQGVQACVSFTPTPTITNTPTLTNTPTITYTPANTGTPTPTPTPSDSPTITSTFSPANTGTSTDTFTITFTPTNTLTYTLTPTPTLTYTLTDTATPTPTPTGTWYTVTYTLTNTPTNTFTGTVPPTTTSTAAMTPTSTSTPTFSYTFTPSNTPTMTFTWTPGTPTWTHTPIVTFTPTSTWTSASIAGPKPVIYPNPATGASVQIAMPTSMSAGSVRIQIFTSGFRKVQNLVMPNVQPGTSLTMQLLDKVGTPLANGFYYVVVTLPNGRQTILRLIILR